MLESKRAVLVVTYIPSPYQVELFEAVCARDRIRLEVAYLLARDRPETWSQLPMTHGHRFLEGDATRYARLMADLEQFDLVVFSYYQHPQVRAAIARRAASGRPWCFWGERPGYRQKLPGLGYWYRRRTFPELFARNVPVWGIGKLAVERYRRELGPDRHYVNLPYFSNLARFAPAAANQGDRAERVFLFSGSLIPRKGVDLLASAFARLARERQVRLHILGDGPLRPRLEAQLAGLPVEFFGFHPWEDLPQFYQAADILCVPSRHDGWALVVPEGLASGLPVIASTATGAARDLIRAEDNGWLVPPSRGDALYRAMKAAAELDTPRLQGRSQAARASVADHQLECGAERFLTAVETTLDAWNKNACSTGNKG